MCQWVCAVQRFPVLWRRVVLDGHAAQDAGSRERAFTGLQPGNALTGRATGYARREMLRKAGSVRKSQGYRTRTWALLLGFHA